MRPAQQVERLRAWRSRLGRELRQIVDAKGLLDRGDPVNHRFEAVLTEQRVLLLLELLAQRAELLSRDDRPQSGKQHDVLVHIDERGAIAVHRGDHESAYTGSFEQSRPISTACRTYWSMRSVFRGPGLDELSADGARPRAARGPSAPPRADLFSDLNQWMLKVLLAPELPDHLLSVPRGRYRNASQLASAAKVSVMSAFRFVQQLRHEGHLHESDAYLRLVRRRELLTRWQSVSLRRAREIPMRFLLRGNPRKELQRMLASGRACLALFAAADALGLGFVEGVPPHVYVPRLAPANLAAWKNVVPVRGDARDLPYDDASFDALILTTVLGEIPDRAAALREAARVLRPGGRLIVGTIFVGDPHWMSPRALRDAATAVGLRHTQTSGSPLGYFARFER